MSTTIDHKKAIEHARTFGEKARAAMELRRATFVQKEAVDFAKLQRRCLIKAEIERIKGRGTPVVGSDSRNKPQAQAHQRWPVVNGQSSWFALKESPNPDGHFHKEIL